MDAAGEPILGTSKVHDDSLHQSPLVSHDTLVAHVLSAKLEPCKALLQRCSLACLSSLGTVSCRPLGKASVGAESAPMQASAARSNFWIHGFLYDASGEKEVIVALVMKADPGRGTWTPGV
jgi:hypothetical protein